MENLPLKHYYTIYNSLNLIYTIIIVFLFLFSVSLYNIEQGYCVLKLWLASFYIVTGAVLDPRLLIAHLQGRGWFKAIIVIGIGAEVEGLLAKLPHLPGAKWFLRSQNGRDLVTLPL